MSTVGEQISTTTPERCSSKADIIHAIAVTKELPDACLSRKKGMKHEALVERFEQEHFSIRHTMPQERQKAARDLVQIFLKHVHDNGSLEVWDEAFDLTTNYFEASGNPIEGSENLLFDPVVVEAYEDACIRTAVILGQHTRMQAEIF